MAEPATRIEKILVIGIFGILAIMSIWKGNTEAATGFATTIGAYALARDGV